MGKKCTYKVVKYPWLTSICNRIVKEEAMPESWQMSELVPMYKGKGDVLECGSSRGIKLLEHGIKIAKRVLQRRLKQAVEIDKMQFGFRPGTSLGTERFGLQDPTRTC